MPRDYKSPRPEVKKTSPLATGILIGVFIGIAIAVAVALVVNFSRSPFVDRSPKTATPLPTPDPAVKTNKSAAAESPAPPAPAAAPAAKAEDKTRFDFYKILPETEEPAPEQELKPQAPPVETPAEPKYKYYIQAGAFQNSVDAEDQKAKLALLGVEASVQTIEVPEKGSVSRVKVGPFNRVNDMNRVRAALTQNGIETSVLKVPLPADKPKPQPQEGKQ